MRWEITQRLCVSAADRAKLSVLDTVSRLRGRGGPAAYPQTEANLGDCMLQYARQLGDPSAFGNFQQRR